MPTDQPPGNDQLDLEAHVRRMVDSIERGDGEPAPSDLVVATAAEPAQPAHPVELAVREILLEIGEDPEREGLIQTPARMHRMWLELTCGYRVDPDRLINGAVFDVGYSEMVVIKGIPFYSLCEHHMLPFFGTTAVGLPAPRPRHRALQDSARRRDVRPAAAGAGADDPADRRLPAGAAEPIRSRGRGGSRASVPGHARSPEGRRHDGDEQRPGNVQDDEGDSR